MTLVDQILKYKVLLESTVDEVANHPRLSLSLTHEIVRTNPDNNEQFELDVYIKFESVMTSAGAKDTRTDPGYGPEWEHTITSIELDLPPIYRDSPAAMQSLGGQLTDEEKTQITNWFELNKDKADEEASQDYASGGSDEDSRADYEYEKIKDRRMGL